MFKVSVIKTTTFR